MSESVKVAVRCRPMNQREIQQSCKNVITIDRTAKSCTLESGDPSGQGKVYQFDACFGLESSTESVYEEVGSYVVEAVLEGYNGTVFAYGQTGCGKSFTMRGFVDRALEHLFEATSTASSATRYLALLTYLEIYNERLRDLLQDATPQLQLKEDPVRGTYVAGGLREVRVKDAPDCRRLVEQGDRRRAAAATKMNQESSRSHAVMTLSLEAIAIENEDGKGPGADGGGGGAVRRGRLHLVDLAGSERQGRTGATGERLKEAAGINLSLSALGNVISALAAGNGRHVPYRDSKLTRLLRDSLGGNARTLMIACLSPADVDAEETLSTLRYAARARCIKNKPVVNEDPKDALLRQYQLELQKLRKMLEAGENQSPGSLRIIPLELDSSDNNGTNKVQIVEIVNGTVETREEEKSEPEDPEREERRRKKREAAKEEVLRRLEKLTIGGEALGDAEARRRRERRRKRLAILAEALQKSAQDGNGGAFEVYGQLKSTEEALKRMAKKARQLEAEAADLQASWDAERRELLRRELLATQLCEAMVPHLRPGCPFRDVESVRDLATWSDELGRWRLPDATSRIALPPPSIGSITARDVSDTIQDKDKDGKMDPNNNGNGSINGGSCGTVTGNGDDQQLQGADDGDEDGEQEQHLGDDWRENQWKNLANAYFKKKRIDKILDHVRKAKTFDPSSRISKSGGSDDSPTIGSPVTLGTSYHHLAGLNLHHQTVPTVPSPSDLLMRPNPVPRQPTPMIHQLQPPQQPLLKTPPAGVSGGRNLVGSWVTSENLSGPPQARGPPRILEALPLGSPVPLVDGPILGQNNRLQRPIL